MGVGVTAFFLSWYRENAQAARARERIHTTGRYEYLESLESERERERERERARAEGDI